MAHLGDFGAALKELDPNAERDTFTFFGEKFEVVANLPPMLAFTVAATITGKVEEEEGMAAMWQAYRVSLDQVLEPWEGEGPDDRPAPLKQFNHFWDLTVTKRADLDSLMKLVMSLFQASGGERPTAQVPDSQPGELSTSPSSSTSSSIPPAFGGDIIPERDLSVPHLVPVSRVLAG